MKEYKLTPKQRIFLETIKGEMPFTMYFQSITGILNKGRYWEDDKIRLNRCVKIWKQKP